LYHLFFSKVDIDRHILNMAKDAAEEITGLHDTGVAPV
jgi:hypothetical protein